MVFELNEEFVKEQNLTEDQVKAITTNGNTFVDTQIAEVKKEYDGKANTDAEAILHGATESIEKLTGIKHEKGQKIGDYMSSAATKYSEQAKSELEKAKNDYLEKAKNVEGNEGLGKELEELKGKYDAAQKKYADYDTVKSDAEKFGSLLQEHTTLKIDQSFGSVRPVFNKDVNEYESKAKWNEFKALVLKTNTIELVDGEAIAVDKDNPHKIAKLKDLVDGSEALKALIQGRQQGGTGAQEAEMEKVEGVPFEVPVDADAKKRSELIRDYLAKKGVGVTSPEYSTQFAELNSKMLKSKTA